jgi:hypothetical protein
MRVGHTNSYRSKGVAAGRSLEFSKPIPSWHSSLAPKKPTKEIIIKRTSITLDDAVYEAGQEIAAQRGFRQSFSAYIAWLIQRDADGGVSREELPPIVKKKAPAPAVKAPKAAKAVKASKPAKGGKKGKR